jgi:predicted phage-related endonuclease
MEWYGNSIKIDAPRAPKKITATRFAVILGFNPWQTPFEAWCEMTKLYVKPFEDTKFTLAGKAIEPLQIEYMRRVYRLKLKTPSDIYGIDYFAKTRGDFFSNVKVFGGMWDALQYGIYNEIECVFEFKTTQRAEDWLDNQIPEYYALQAALYAHLLKINNVCMVASFLSDEDYLCPEKFKPNVSNTQVFEFKVSERYPNFDEYILKAQYWWANHIEKGVSPEFDEIKDAAILKELRRNNVNSTTEITALLEEAEELKSMLSAHYAKVDADEKRLKNLSEQIKKIAILNFRTGDAKVSLDGQRYTWTVSKSVSLKINSDNLKADGLFNKYATESTIYKLTTSEKE